MTTQVTHLEAFLGQLKQRSVDLASVENRLYDEWAVFPAVANKFDPSVASESRQWIWWSASSHEAFADGEFERPALFHWHGHRGRLQLAAARAGLCIRLVSTEEYDQGGVFVIEPGSADTETDLSRLLDAFERMEQDGIIALPHAGEAQSHGWEDVAERQKSAKQTAVFWHGQSHEAFNDVGMLEGSMCLYWRGSKTKLAKHLSSAGFDVVVPESEDRAFEVASSDPAPQIAAVADAEAFEEALERTVRVSSEGGPEVLSHSSDVEASEEHHRPGASIAGLWWTPAGEVMAATTLTQQEWDEPLALLNPTTFKRLSTYDHSSVAATCVGACWLPDGRWLAAWHDQAEGHEGLVYKVVEDGTHVCIVHDAENGRIDSLALARDAGTLALARRNSVSVHQIGPAGTKLEVAAKPRGMLARRRKSKPADPAPKPWAELAKFDVQPETYTRLAMSADGTRLVRTGPAKNRGLTALVGYDVASGDELWSWRPGSFLCEGRAQMCGLAFSHDDTHLIVSLRSLAKSGPEREADPNNRGLVFIDAATGKPSRPELTDALKQSRCAWVSPEGKVWIGHEDGSVSVHDPLGAETGRTKVFDYGSVSAIAGSQHGVCVGSTRGELALLAQQA